MRFVLFFILFPFPAVILFTSFGCDKNSTKATIKGEAQDIDEANNFVGSKRCRSCHEDFYKLWATSHHGLAMQPFTADFAKKNLVPPKNKIKIHSKFFSAKFNDQSGFVIEEGPAEKKHHKIEHVMGGKDIYYFLTPLDRGRLQVLPIAFDIRQKEWFDTTASAVRHFTGMTDEALDWKERPLTFNTSCYSCHVSQLSTNYDFKTDSYHTTWAEPGINCETCHGPCGDHIRVCRQAHDVKTIKDLKIIKTSDFTVAQTNDMCAPCHAKMSAITKAFVPGERFFDHYDLVTLEDPDFYPDGRDLGENYTYTLWRMSPCARSGKLSCMHCHTSSGRYRFKQKDEDNACLPCHEKEVKTKTGHTHHPADSDGSKCIACHMPMTEFARMRRTDHTMLPPTPSATIRFKSPNACNICHSDKDAAWADKYVRKWYKHDYQAPVLKRAGLLIAARKGDRSRLPEILKYLSGGDCDEIYATSFIRLLRNFNDEKMVPVLRKKLSDKSPLVRSSAASVLGTFLTRKDVDALLVASKDPYRLVRIRAAYGLAPAFGMVLKKKDKENLNRATEEYMESLKARRDDFTSRYNLGNFFSARGEFEKAIESFESAERLQPSAVAPLVNASMACARLRDNKRAETFLRRALRIDSRNGAAHFNLGILLAEKGDREGAESHLAAALKTEPTMSAAAYNLGVLLANSPGRMDEAVKWCRKAYDLEPGLSKYAYTYAFYLYKKGDNDEAVKLLEKLTSQRPAVVDYFFLLGKIYEETGRPGKARSLYKSALMIKDMPEDKRQLFKIRLQR